MRPVLAVRGLTGEEESEVQAKGDLVAELNEKTTSVTIRELTPEGARADYNFQGEVKGRYNALHMDTVTALLKPDGTSEYDVRGIESTSDGDVIFVRGKGRGSQRDPNTVAIEGDVNFQTTSKKLAWLNTTKGKLEGTFSVATGEFKGKVYARK